MKKILFFLLVIAFSFTLIGCANKDLDVTELKVTFVPSRDPEAILQFTAPLAQLLKEKLIEKGFTNLVKVTVDVSATYEAAGEALDAGTTDVAFLPGGTYALYSADGNIEVILASTRDGLSKDSVNAKDWNDGLATMPTKDQVTFYRSIVVAGPSVKGRELAAKVNAGQALTWEDLNGAKWGVQGATSSAGTVYPSVWLSEKFNGKLVTDLAFNAPTGSYGNSLAGLAAGTYDVVSMYADARRDYEQNWISNGEGGYGRTASIWAETDVIIVTPGIFNDTISISSKTVSKSLAKALQETFIELAQTAAGKEIFAVYSHAGYAVVTDKDYDAARAAQAIVSK